MSSECWFESKPGIVVILFELQQYLFLIHHPVGGPVRAGMGSVFD